MLELLFVGAGPHSLATLTRLLEPNPDPGVDAPQRHVNAKAKVTRESVWVSAWQHLSADDYPPPAAVSALSALADATYNVMSKRLTASRQWCYTLR